MSTSEENNFLPLLKKATIFLSQTKAFSFCEQFPKMLIDLNSFLDNQPSNFLGYILRRMQQLPCSCSCNSTKCYLQIDRDQQDLARLIVMHFEKLKLVQDYSAQAHNQLVKELIILNPGSFFSWESLYQQIYNGFRKEMDSRLLQINNTPNPFNFLSTINKLMLQQFGSATIDEQGESIKVLKNKVNHYRISELYLKYVHFMDFHEGQKILESGECIQSLQQAIHEMQIPKLPTNNDEIEYQLIKTKLFWCQFSVDLALDLIFSLQDQKGIEQTVLIFKVIQQLLKNCKNRQCGCLSFFLLELGRVIPFHEYKFQIPIRLRPISPSPARLCRLGRMEIGHRGKEQAALEFPELAVLKLYGYIHQRFKLYKGKNGPKKWRLLYYEDKIKNTVMEGSQRSSLLKEVKGLVKFQNNGQSTNLVKLYKCMGALIPQLNREETLNLLKALSRKAHNERQLIRFTLMRQLLDRLKGQFEPDLESNLRILNEVVSKVLKNKARAAGIGSRQVEDLLNLARTQLPDREMKDFRDVKKRLKEAVSRGPVMEVVLISDSPNGLEE